VPFPYKGLAAVTLTWKPNYTTGVASLDKQHRHLFDLFNRLEMAIGQGDYDSPCVQTILDEMGADLREHFECEERCMSRRRCPMADKNKQEHDRLLAIFRQFLADFSSGKTPAALENFHREAEWWLLEHVCFVDIHLRACSKPADGG
jgi:hemerythrin-like metal-binding protein